MTVRRPKPLAGGSADSEVIELGFDRSDVESLLEVRMPYGRYSGRPLIDLPEEYLLWFERESFPQGRLGHLMKLSLGIKRHGAERVVKRLRQVLAVQDRSAGTRDE